MFLGVLVVFFGVSIFKLSLRIWFLWFLIVFNKFFLDFKIILLLFELWYWSLYVGSEDWF